MIPRYHIPMHPSMPSRQFRQQPPGRALGRPMMGGPMMSRTPQMRQGGGGGGGFLSKLLGKGKQMGQVSGATRSIGAQQAAGGGSILKSFTNPSAINGFLTNTQKVLNTAQQVGPMINQYGPLVKNIPAMWKLYRGFKNAPDATSNKKASTTHEEQIVPANQSISTVRKEVNEELQERIKTNKESPSLSKPKLYI
jgi:hypothetical protein